MTEDKNQFAVEHRPDEARYVLVDNGSAGDNSAGSVEAGEEQYVELLDGTDRPVRVFHHTGVDETYGGRGLASVLVRFAVDDTISAGFGVVPVCPYVAAWFKKHPELAEHAVAPRPEHLAAIR